MIVPRSPHLLRMVQYIGKPLASLFAFDMVVAVAYVYLDWDWLAMPHVPLSIFGGAIGVILGFRNNSGYQRWWEARTLWGAIVNNSRSLARQARSMITPAPGQGNQEEAVFAMQRNIVYHQIAWVHALRGHLRQHEFFSELQAFLTPAELASLKGEQNVPAELQRRIGLLLQQCLRNSWLDTILWSSMDATLTALANAQGGSERIKNTPMPKQYDFFPRLFIAVYCILLPLGMVANLGLLTPIGSTLVGFIFLALEKIGRDLEEPFSNNIHDIPLTAMSRTIEINLRQHLGETELPAPEKPVRGVLW